MKPEEFEQLHEEYLKALLDYHNHYVGYIKGKQGRSHVRPMRIALGNMIKLCKLLRRAVLQVHKNKLEQYKDGYQYQRTNKRNPSIFKQIHNDNSKKTNDEQN